MHYLDETHILIFLVQLLLLLGIARGLGLLFQRYGQPAITAEILVGVLLGPTVLGRALPRVEAALFPADPVQTGMLDAVAWLGVLFFLLATGLETEFAGVWRQKTKGLIIAVSDIIIPMVIVFVPSFLLASVDASGGVGRFRFALFMATIMSMSALPVTARVLQDLGIYRTDVGLLVVSALTLNDVSGWVIFALLVGFVARGTIEFSHAGFILIATGGFIALALTAGRYFADRTIKRIQRMRLAEPGVSLTLISLIGVLFGVITMSIGIHALFGFFMAGLVAGESEALSQRARQVMSQMVRAILVPVFFAAVGLRIDFLANFSLPLVLFVTLLGIAARFGGAWVGTVLALQPRANRLLISVAHVAGGEMQVVVGVVAFQYGILTETTFEAIVFGAVISSMALGPWMDWALRLTRRGSILEFLNRGGIAACVKAETKEDCIRQLAPLVAWHKGIGPVEEVIDSVLERESARTTALSDGIVVPHARLASARGAVVVAATLYEGVEWDAPDGRPARIVFLIVTPAERDDLQIMILRAIAFAMIRPENREALIEADNDAELWSALHVAFAARPE